MAWLLALLLGEIGPSTPAAEPPLPLSLISVEITSPAAELPERDSLWRVVWLDLAVAAVDAESSVFHWPEFTIRPDEGRLPPAAETWEPYFTSRIDLGMTRLRQMEAEPRVFPAISRAILGVPLGLIEALTSAVAPDVIIVNGKQVFNQVAASDDLATTAGRTFLKAEMSFLGNIQKSYVNTIAVQLGTEEPDESRMKRLQYRAFFTGMKNAYRERYQIPAMDLDTILATVSTGDWVDVIIIPTAVSLYAARFGFERRIKVSDDLRIEVHIEKASRFRKSILDSDHSGRLLTVAFNVFQLPVSAIVSVDAMNGGLGYGFIGIGTDINSALTTVYNNRPPNEKD